MTDATAASRSSCVTGVDRDCSSSAKSPSSASRIRSGWARTETVTVPPSASNARCAAATTNSPPFSIIRFCARELGLSTSSAISTSSARASAVPHAGARNATVSAAPSVSPKFDRFRISGPANGFSVNRARGGAFPFGASWKAR